MFNKTKIALAAIIIVGAASAAMAGGDASDDGWSHERGEGRTQSWQDVQRSQESIQRRIAAEYHTANAASAYGLGSPTHKKSRRDH
jgi:hypothetical protein